MTSTNRAMVGLAAVCVLSLGISPTFAQGGPIDPEVYNSGNVHPWHPFDSPDINVEELDLANLAVVADEWEGDDLLEIRQRCSAIVADPGRDAGGDLLPGIGYSEAAVAFCNAVFAWTDENRPDAPNNWAELQAMVD